MYPRDELEGEREGGAKARPEGLREVAELYIYIYMYIYIYIYICTRAMSLRESGRAAPKRGQRVSEK